MRRLAGELERRGFAKELDELFVDDLDDLLRRREALHHLFADARVRARGDELLDDFEVDVRLQQGEAHFAQGSVDVGLAQFALAGETVKHASAICRQDSQTRYRTVQSVERYRAFPVRGPHASQSSAVQARD